MYIALILASDQDDINGNVELLMSHLNSNLAAGQSFELRYVRHGIGGRAIRPILHVRANTQREFVELTGGLIAAGRYITRVMRLRDTAEELVHRDQNLDFFNFPIEQLRDPNTRIQPAILDCFWYAVASVLVAPSNLRQLNSFDSTAGRFPELEFPYLQFTYSTPETDRELTYPELDLSWDLRTNPRRTVLINSMIDDFIGDSRDYSNYYYDQLPA